MDCSVTVFTRVSYALFSPEIDFKFTMRIIDGFHCLVKKTKEDKSFVVIGV